MYLTLEVSIFNYKLLLFMLLYIPKNKRKTFKEKFKNTKVIPFKFSEGGSEISSAVLEIKTLNSFAHPIPHHPSKSI